VRTHAARRAERRNARPSALAACSQGEVARLAPSGVSSAALDRDADALQALCGFADSGIDLLERALLAAGPAGPASAAASAAAAAAEPLDLSVLAGAGAVHGYLEQLAALDGAVAGLARGWG
jgi:hypothetical protein